MWTLPVGSSFALVSVGPTLSSSDLILFLLSYSQTCCLKAFREWCCTFLINFPRFNFQSHWYSSVHYIKNARKYTTEGLIRSAVCLWFMAHYMELCVFRFLCIFRVSWKEISTKSLSNILWIYLWFHSTTTQTSSNTFLCRKKMWSVIFNIQNQFQSCLYKHFLNNWDAPAYKKKNG